MSYLGVELQGRFAHVVLADERDGAIVYQPVSDGARALIPFCAEGDRWGTEAARNFVREFPLADPEAFWPGLYARVSRFLGTNPTSENELHLRIACPSASCGHQRAMDLAKAAGFEDAVCMDPVDGAALGWLGVSTELAERQLLAAVVHVGDSVTQVAGYRVIGTKRRFAVETANDSVSQCGVGYRALSAPLAGMVYERFPEEGSGLPRGYHLALEESILALLAQLAAKASAFDPLEWKPPLASQLNSRLRITRDECVQWPNSEALRRQMLGAFQRITEVFGEPPGAVVLSGLGAQWPGLGAACGDIPIIRAPHALAASATGAALYNLLPLTFSERQRS